LLSFALQLLGCIPCFLFGLAQHFAGLSGQLADRAGRGLRGEPLLLGFTSGCFGDA